MILVDTQSKLRQAYRDVAKLDLTLDVDLTEPRRGCVARGAPRLSEVIQSSEMVVSHRIGAFSSRKIRHFKRFPKNDQHTAETPCHVP